MKFNFLVFFYFKQNFQNKKKLAKFIVYTRFLEYIYNPQDKESNTKNQNFCDLSVSFHGVPEKFPMKTECTKEVDEKAPISPKFHEKTPK